MAGHVPDAGAPAAALADPDPTVRAVALGAMARRGELDFDALARAMTDPDAEVRRRAAELATAPDPPAQIRDRLHRLLEDPEAMVAETAAATLGELPGNPATVSLLAAMATDHADPLCREAAVAALGAIGDPAGLPSILRATSDKPAVRRRAVIALAPFDGPEVDAALERALSDRDWQVRQAAEDQMGRD